MQRRADIKIRTTDNQKQMRVDKLMYRQRKARSANFLNNRNLDGEAAESPRSNTTPMAPKNTDVKPATAAEKKNRLKEYLRKWHQSQKKRITDLASQKNQKPDFVVSRHYKATPAAALPSVKNSTYSYVSPRVVTRRDPKMNSTFTKPALPSKFNFIGSGSQENVKPDVFVFAAAPMTNRYY